MCQCQSQRVGLEFSPCVTSEKTQIDRTDRSLFFFFFLTPLILFCPENNRSCLSLRQFPQTPRKLVVRMGQPHLTAPLLGTAPLELLLQLQAHVSHVSFPSCKMGPDTVIQLPQTPRSTHSTPTPPVLLVHASATNT